MRILISRRPLLLYRHLRSAFFSRHRTQAHRSAKFVYNPTAKVLLGVGIGVRRHERLRSMTMSWWICLRARNASRPSVTTSL